MEELEVERVVYFNEKVAYQNLKKYDDGDYLPQCPVKKEIHLKYSDFSLEKELDIDDRLLNEYVKYGKIINSRHSNFNPGEYAEKNSYEATFSKKCYYNSELEFI
ncbi:death-on-curing family protein, partial [Listeria monocytogenes]|nr:death-on-curing family protein [Listeria monocytogenes]